MPSNKEFGPVVSVNFHFNSLLKMYLDRKIKLAMIDFRFKKPLEIF